MQGSHSGASNRMPKECFAIPKPAAFQFYALWPATDSDPVCLGYRLGLRTLQIGNLQVAPMGSGAQKNE